MLPKLKRINCIIIVFASLFQAFGIYNIHAVSNVTEGGVLGATLLLRHWFGISPALTSFILNIACYGLGWETLGKEIIGYVLIAITCYATGYAVWE